MSDISELVHKLKTNEITPEFLHDQLLAQKGSVFAERQTGDFQTILNIVEYLCTKENVAVST